MTNRPDLQMNFLVVARKVQAEVVVFGVVGLRRVDNDQAGSPERALRIDLKLYIVNF